MRWQAYVGCGALALAGFGLAPADSSPSRQFEERWSPTLRTELGLASPATRECPDEETPSRDDLTGTLIERDVPEALRQAIGAAWADVWLTCNGERLEVGIVYGPRPAVERRIKRARAVLRRKKLSDRSRLVAVEVTLRELIQAQGRIKNRLAELVEENDVEVGRSSRRNAVVIRVPETLPAARRRRALAAARGARVPVSVEEVDADETQDEPT